MQPVCVVPGERIKDDCEDWVFCQGSYADEDGLPSASLAGFVWTVNKLLFVKTVQSVYTPTTGDVVVGRVVDVGLDRWHVQLNAHLKAVLPISTTDLPSGALRKRTAADALNMRSLFDVGDILSAEVFEARGTPRIHMRDGVFGKLKRGLSVNVPASLVPHLSLHFVALPFVSPPVDAIFGCNGVIWLAPAPESAAIATEAEARARGRDRTQLFGLCQRECTAAEYASIARIRGALLVLAKAKVSIMPATVKAVVEAADAAGVPTAGLSLPQHAEVLLKGARTEALESLNEATKMSS